MLEPFFFISFPVHWFSYLVCSQTWSWYPTATIRKVYRLSIEHAIRLRKSVHAAVKIKLALTIFTVFTTMRLLYPEHATLRLGVNIMTRAVLVHPVNRLLELKTLLHVFEANTKNLVRKENSTLDYKHSVTFCPDGTYCCGSRNSTCCDDHQGNAIITYLKHPKMPSFGSPPNIGPSASTKAVIGIAVVLGVFFAILAGAVLRHRKNIRCISLDKAKKKELSSFPHSGNFSELGGENTIHEMGILRASSHNTRTRGTV